MQYCRILSLSLALSILCASCTKEVRYSKEQMLDLAKAQDSSVTLVLPRSMSEGVHCTDYSEGCLSGHTVKVKGLDMIAVEFNTEAQARYAAKKYRGYYLRNWLLDDVTGEPVLEEFALSLKAQKP